MTHSFRTTAGDSTQLPSGIPYIIGNEAAERFSFYGMKGILVVYMSTYMLTSDGSPDLMGEEEARGVYHLFTGAAYFFPLLGAIIADAFWGKYRTILVLSLGYCIGHALIACGDFDLGTSVLPPRHWLFLGMVFIAIGSGGIKPCVSAHVGDQFGANNSHLISKTFGWFYFSINIGAALSMALAQPLLENYGAWLAFGLPGVLMGLATFVFWMGRHHFVHIPPSGWTKFVQRTFNPEGRRALLNLAPIFLIFIPVFWALFDQTGSSWVQQARMLDRHFLGIDWYESQIQIANPILILLLIPVFSYIVYPLAGRFFKVTPLRKIGAGLFLTVVAFAIPALVETQITGGRVVPFRLDGKNEMSTAGHADAVHFHENNMIDGRLDEGAWISRPVSASAEDAAPLAVVTIQLRERSQWHVNRIQIHAAPKIDDFLSSAAQSWADNPGNEDEITGAEWFTSAGCRPRTIAVYHAPTRIGPWTKSSEISMAIHDETVQLDLLSFEAGFIQLRVMANHGGRYVAIGEIEVFAEQGAVPEYQDNVATTGQRPTIAWQLFAYLLLTAAEVMVSITALEFAYTQAPPALKSLVMGVYLLGVSLGNFFTSGVNFVLDAFKNDDGTTMLEGAGYFLFFTALMLFAAIAFAFYARFYRGNTFVQGDSDTSGEAIYIYPHDITHHEDDDADD
jgi:POT family proton-dependent oligopeptide transporter